MANITVFNRQAVLHQRFAPAAAAVAGKLYVCGGADATWQAHLLVRWAWITRNGYVKITLWLCQNSYWQWPFMVDFPIEDGDFP